MTPSRTTGYPPGRGSYQKGYKTVFHPPLAQAIHSLSFHPHDPMTDVTKADIDEPAATLRYVFISRARCPLCSSDDLHTRKTENNGDGSITRDTKCRGCKHHFSVIVE